MCFGALYSALFSLTPQHIRATCKAKHYSNLASEFIKQSSEHTLRCRSKFLPGVSLANPGKRVNFCTHPVAQQYPDQLAPYRAFGCDVATPFRGTLFRFPLRTAALAASSQISQQVGQQLTKFRLPGHCSQVSIRGCYVQSNGQSCEQPF